MAYLIILLGSTGYGVLLGQPHHPVPASINRVANLLHIQEGWAMYANFPPTLAWFMAPGRLSNGEEVGVLQRAPLDRRKPSDIQSALRGFRWTMYFYNVIARGTGDPAFQTTHLALLDYLCRDWNGQNPPERRLRSVSLVMVTELMPRPDSAQPPGRPSVLATRTCP